VVPSQHPTPGSPFNRFLPGHRSGALIPIADPGDPRVALYCGLRDADLRRRLESGHGVFVVEGARSVRVLVASGWPVISLLLRPERLAGMADAVHAAQRQGAPVYIASPDVFDRISGFPLHRGVLALAGRRARADAMALLDGISTAVIVEGVNDHENMGAVFRNAAALGAGAVLLDPRCCDPLYRRAVRVSVGHVLRVPFGRLEPWPAALDAVSRHGFRLIALDPAGPDRIDEFVCPGPIALLAGGEGEGLTEGARNYADHRVRISMTAGVDSLNVATALAIALHRLARP
jgi:tRNA G18 (ribose-2'-O)-methylase SpoU